MRLRLRFNGFFDDSQIRSPGTQLRFDCVSKSDPAFRLRFDKCVRLRFGCAKLHTLVVNKRAFFAFRVLFEARFSRVSRFYTRVSVFSEFRVSGAFISSACGKRRVSANALQSAYIYAAFRVSRFKNN